MLVTIVSNLSMLGSEAFWIVLDHRNLMHPFNDRGRRCTYRDIPKAIDALVDDPFRSLAGELRGRVGLRRIRHRLVNSCGPTFSDAV